LGFIFFLLGILFYFFPVSGKYLDGKLSALLEKDCGRRVDVVGACVYFSRGLITIREITIYSDQENGQPFSMQGITLDFSPVAVLLSQPGKWQNLHISFPMEIPFLIRDSRIVPGDEFNHMIPFLRTILAGAGGKKDEGIRKVHVNLDAVSLSRSSYSDAKIILHPLIKMEKLSLVFSFQEGLLGVVTSEGIIRSELQGDFRGLLTFHPDGTPDHLMLYFSHIFLSDKSVPAPDFLFDAVNLKITEKMESMDEWLTLFHEISIDSLSMNIQGVNKTFQENRIQFKGATEFRGSNKFLQVSESKLSIDDSDMILEGGITLSGSYPFSLEMEQSPISNQTMNLLRSLLLPTGWDMTFQPQSLELFLEAYGELSHLKDTRILGSLRFAEVALRHREFPLPITGLKGLVTLNRSVINISGVTGRYGDGSISLEAHVSGSGDFSPPEKISLSWTTDLLIQDILMTIGDRIPMPEGSLEGDLVSTGTLELDMIHSDEYTSFSLNSLGGFVEIRNGNLHLDRLPFDIRGIKGRLNIQNNSIESMRLSGSVLDANISIEGKIEGDAFFWEKPMFSGSIEYSGDMEPLIQAAPDSLENILRNLEAKGTVDVKTRVTLPVLEPSRGSFSGRIRLSDGSFVPDHPSIQGHFKKMSADVRFVDRAIFFDRVTGEFSEMPFNVQGTLVQDRLQFGLESLVDLAVLREAIPPLSEDFRASGTVELNCSASLPPPLLKSLLTNSPLPDKSGLQISGTIRARDASFAYEDMPADLTHLNGLIIFSEKGLKYDQMKCWCGESPDCAIDGEVVFEQRPLLVRFQVQVPELFFTEWTGSWSSKDPSSSFFSTMKDLTSSSPTLEVDGAILANKIHFNRLEGDAFQAHFIYNFFPNAPNKFSFDNVNVKVYGGQARASGNMLFPTGTFYYGVEGETENMDLNPMLSALRGEEDNFTGFLTSTVTLAGESGKPASIRSKIKFDVKQSRFISNVILTGLGKALHSSLLDDITFSRIRGTVEILDDAARFQDVTFTSPLVNLNASGSVDLHENVDIICYLAFDRKNIFSLPVFKQIAGILEYMGKAFLKFHITGTLQNPQVKTIPLSADELKKLLPWF
jgi:hypothetical protein